MSRVQSFIPAPVPARIDSAQDVRDFANSASKVLGQPTLRAHVSAAPQSGGARVYTVRVVNVNPMPEPCKGIFHMLVWVSASLGGDPSDVHTAVFVTGTAVKTILINGMWEALTTSDGTLSISVAAAAGQSRAVHAVILGVADSSGLETFT